MRRFDVARGATVRICDASGRHYGQGLVLEVDEDGTAVLTCHHVIAHLRPDNVSMMMREASGRFGPPLPLRYDSKRSRPAADAVVLRAQGVPSRERPTLCSLNPITYSGGLDRRATGVTCWKTDTFDARIGASTSIDVQADVPGPWPDPPERYLLSAVFRMADATDVREGISGSVIVYEDGVLGLAHFSRAAGEDYEREAYMVPLTAWSEGWPALERLIEPLVDAPLRNAATVKRAVDLRVGDDITIAAYRPDVYFERSVAAAARAALDRGRLVIVGRPKSGKTRLAWQLLQEHADAIAVIPRLPPPERFETSGFWGRHVILFFDDLHRTGISSAPAEWLRRFTEATGQRVQLLATSRDGDDWRRVQGQPGLAPLMEVLTDDTQIFVSRAEQRGQDLSDDEARKLARALGLSKKEFAQRFDGTPGSLTLDLTDMRKRYESLRGEFVTGVSMARLLDAAKLVYEAGQPRLQLPLIRTVAERVRGDSAIAPEVWETVLRRTREEGFGQVDPASGDFQIYRPYLEECVTYAPPPGDLDALTPCLTAAKDFDGLARLGQMLFMRYHDLPAAERAVRAARDGGHDEADGILGWILADQPGREEETEQFYRTRLAAGKESWVNFGNFLNKTKGAAAAEEAYREAASHDGGDAALGYWSLGNLLRRDPERRSQAEEAYRQAANRGLLMAQIDLGELIAAQSARASEAEQALRAAIDAASAELEAADNGDDSFGKEAAHDKASFVKGLLARAYFCLGIVLSESNRIQDAEDAYRAGAKYGSIESWANLGALLADEGTRLSEAEDAFRHAAAGGAEHSLENLARVLAAQAGKEREAEETFRQAVLAGDTTAYLYLGQLLVKSAGRWSEAEAAFVSAADAGIAEAHEWLGYLLAQQPGREGEAEAAFRAAVSANVTTAFRLLGDLIAQNPERWPEAEAVYRDGITHGATDVYSSFGRLLAEQPGRETDAERTFRAGATAGDARCSYDLGVQLVLAEHYAEAEDELRHAMSAGIIEAELPLGSLLTFLPNRHEEGCDLLRHAASANVDGAADALAKFCTVPPPGPKPRGRQRGSPAKPARPTTRSRRVKHTKGRKSR